MISVRVRSHLTTTMHFYLHVFVVSNDKMKWVAWLPMIPFTPDDKKIVSLSSSANGPLVVQVEKVEYKNIFYTIASYFFVRYI